ncbi:tRNA 2-selenouridine(34) synthase MnmH [SAR92 clade bacterium H455]|uniref:tRNA 2-selenouridine synthase n=1 Tax=SAR92 clade bacterium H455 TaxID=2974818 RepID=A0ABY5TLF9_9GAMM|nr:tRNA 2-selenouridine(34) synthase MnmH [SAR92 clade bacterium H455]
MTSSPLGALPLVNDYRQLLLDGTPMIDVRAPIEFASGALPNAVNLPLISDDERHQVGICYKEQGQQAAIDLGHQLVQGDVKAQRIEAWQSFMAANPNAVLYCARGGLRSQLSQEWLAEAGIQCPKVTGGYKSLRGFLFNYLNDYCLQDHPLNKDRNPEKFIILSGMTGTGKTDIMLQLETGINLEGAANHKGSSFGRPLNGQPAQIDVENRIALDLLKIEKNHPGKTVILEDESRNIGARHLPPCLADLMAQSPIVVIELPLEERIDRLWQEYVIERYNNTLAYHGDRGEEEFSQYLVDSLLRVKRRLGGKRTQEILALMESAIALQHTDEFASHRQWLNALTVDYYDPMYSYQLSKKQERVLFRGDRTEVMEWLGRR